MGRVVVIDGPAGSGKSTTAMVLARRLGYVYLDTGAMYRAITLKIMRNSESILSDAARLGKLLDDTVLDLRQSDDGFRIFLDGEDVTQRIRTADIDSKVSEVSAVPAVREFMQKQQRAFGEKHNLVAEGRDLGTYVFPNADVKIFMVADLAVRAERRRLQLKAAPSEKARLAKNLQMRDEIDSGRTHSPLKKAPDAVVIDTTNMTFDQQVDEILKICLAKLK